MWIKICANTNLEDALLAAELGADAVGFVFAPSKRQVTAAQVAGITPHLPVAVERVGVFHSHDAGEIAGIVRDAGVTAAQLHGGLDEALAEELHAGGIPMIQTLHWTLDAPDAAEVVSRQLEHLATLGTIDRVLIDSKVGAATGGTGVSFDWTLARAVFAAAPSSLRLIVAGGLGPANVAEAIAEIAPWGVDVASGVESTPGRKDPARLRAFLKNARAKRESA